MSFCVIHCIEMKVRDLIKSVHNIFENAQATHHGGRHNDA